MIDITIPFGKNLKYPIGELRYGVGGTSVAAQSLVLTPWNRMTILRCYAFLFTTTDAPIHTAQLRTLG